MVAWDASPAASRALYDAMPLLAMAAEVVVITIVGDKVLQPEESGEQVCAALAQRDIAARFEPVRERDEDVGATLLQAAIRAEAGLLVMGGFAHPRTRVSVWKRNPLSLPIGFPAPCPPVALKHAGA